jgi:DNA-binding FadR family transcriptional regulator
VPSSVEDPSPAASPERREIDLERIARRPKASDLVAGQLRRLVLNGDLADGDQLPPETQLTLRFGVSRPTVREAFRILETEGLISVAHGSRCGARVNAPRIETAARYAGFALRAAGATLGETYEAQLAIEPFAVRQLAERRTPEVMAELEARLAALEQLNDPQRTAERSVALAHYHLLIVKLTGNRTLTLMAEMLAKVLETHQTRHRPPVKETARGMPEAKFRTLGSVSIRKLLGFIREGDADAAEAHWRIHLRNAAAFWLTGSDPSMVIDIDD